MYKKILAVTDGSELSIRAVKEAAGLAAVVGAKLLVLHVRSPVEIPHHAAGGALPRLGEETIMQEIEREEQNLLQAAKDAAAAAGVVPDVAFVAGYEAYEGIVRIAGEQQCDLIVMGTHVRHGITGILVQSETQKVLAHSPLPVLVLR